MVSDIPSLAATTAALLQPYLPVIATKAAEKIGSELPGTVSRLWQAIKSKFKSRETAQETLADLLKAPADEDLLAAFRVQLKKALENDPAFAASLAALLKEAQSETGNSIRQAQTRSGAVAQGDSSRAVGERGILIEGDARDNIFVTGDNNDVDKGDQ